MLASAFERHPSIFFGAMAMASAAVGVMLAHGQERLPLPLIALAALALILTMMSVPPSKLFVGWLFLAPLLDNAAASHIGKPLGLAFYALPAAVLAIVTATHLSRGVQLSLVDFLPAVYVAYALVSIVVTSPMLQPTLYRSIEIVFLNTVLGPVLYYFLVVGPGTAVRSLTLFRVLMIGACIQGALAIVEAGTTRNLWGYHVWDNADGEGLRVVSTFSNPALLGAYLGIGIVTATTVLTWGGPRTLHRLARLTLVLSIPALLATLTRAPIVATALAVLLVLILGRRRLLGIVLIACLALALFVAWPQIRSTSAYQKRAGNIETILVREQIQRVSVELWRQKPVLGWGFGSFDRVKSGAELPYVPGLSGKIYVYAQRITSHNTYLTTLVELGFIGLLLLLGPFAVIVAKALAHARSLAAGLWIVVSGCGSLLVVMFTGITVDYRFFSFVPALSFVLLALVRRLAGDWETAR